MEYAAEFERGVTAHGLEVWVQRVPSRQVAIGIVVFCGMRHDPVDQPGLSHALEHALTTQEGPCGDVIGKQRFVYRRRCLPFGMGSTSAEAAFWMVRGLKAKLPLMLQWLATITRCVPRDFSLKRLVEILNREYAEERNPRDIALRGRVWSPLIPAYHPLFTPERPEFISRLNRCMLAAHWERYYTIPNMALVAVGDTTMSAMCAAAERAFPAMTADASAQRAAVTPLTATPTICGELHLDLAAILGNAGLGECDFNIRLCRVLPPSAIPYEATEVALGVLSEAAFTELRERRGIAYSIDVGVAPFRDLWTHEVGVTFAPARYDAVTRIFRCLPEFVAQHGKDAFADVKSRLTAQFVLRDKTLERIAEQAIENLASFGVIESRRKVVRAIVAVTFADVCRVLEGLFAYNRVLTVITHPSA